MTVIVYSPNCGWFIRPMGGKGQTFESDVQFGLPYSVWIILESMQIFSEYPFNRL